MSDAQLHEFPGRSLSLSLPVEDESARLGPALDALGELQEVVQPLSAELHVVCDLRDAPRPFWLIAQESLPPGAVVKETWNDMIVEQAPRLTRPTLEAWVKRAIAQPCPDGEVADWGELSIGTTRARLPDPNEWRGRDTLLLEHGITPRSDPDHGGEPITSSIPIHWDGAQAWAAGPADHLGLQAPVTIQFRNSADLELRVSVHWSIWSHGPGAPLLAAPLNRLVIAGWQVEDDGLGLIDRG